MILRILLTVVAVIVGLLIAVAVYVRLAPSVPADWHVMPAADVVGDTDGTNFHTVARQITTSPEEMLTAVNQVILETPRTAVLAGDVASGMITYVTRSKLFGFPDYTTVAIKDGPLFVIHSRARYGTSDIGVNKLRMADWIDRLGPLVVPPA